MGRNALIFDIKPLALHDGPGIRTTVFFKGCPMNCLWCQNPESRMGDVEIWRSQSRCRFCGHCATLCPVHAITIDAAAKPAWRWHEEECQFCLQCEEACPHHALYLVGRKMSCEQIVAVIEKDLPFFRNSGGGATFSGGEPMAQIDALEELLVLCQRRGIHTAIDTAGYVDEPAFARILDKADLFLYDLKFVDTRLHMQYTGVSNERILSNYRFLRENGKDIIVRVPLIPAITDTAENLSAIADFLAGDKDRIRLEFVPFNYLAIGKNGLHDLVKDLPLDAFSERLKHVRADFTEKGFQVIC